MVNPLKISFKIETVPGYNGSSDIAAIIRDVQVINGVTISRADENYNISLNDENIALNKNFLGPWSRLFNNPAFSTKLDLASIKDSVAFTPLLKATIPAEVIRLKNQRRPASSPTTLTKALGFTVSDIVGNLSKDKGIKIKILPNITTEDILAAARSTLARMTSGISRIINSSGQAAFNVEVELFDDNEEITNDFTKAATTGHIVYSIRFTNPKANSFGTEAQALHDVLSIASTPLLDIELEEIGKELGHKKFTSNKTPKQKSIDLLVASGMNEKAAEEFYDIIKDFDETDAEDRPVLCGKDGLFAELKKSSGLKNGTFFDVTGLPKEALSKKNYHISRGIIEAFVKKFALEDFRDAFLVAAGIDIRAEFESAIASASVVSVQTQIVVPNEDPRRAELIANLGKIGIAETGAIAIYDLLLDQEQRLAARRADPNSAPAPRKICGRDSLLANILELSKLSKGALFERQMKLTTNVAVSTTNDDSYNLIEESLMKVVDNGGFRSFANIFRETNGLTPFEKDSFLEDTRKDKLIGDLVELGIDSRNAETMYVLLKTQEELLAKNDPSALKFSGKNGLIRQLQIRSGLSDQRFFDIGKDAATTVINLGNDSHSFLPITVAQIVSNAGMHSFAEVIYKTSGSFELRSKEEIINECHKKLEEGDKVAQTGEMLSALRKRVCLVEGKPMAWLEAANTGKMPEDLTQQNLADRISAVPASVRRWEKNNSPVRNKAEALAEFYAIDSTLREKFLEVINKSNEIIALANKAKPASTVTAANASTPSQSSTSQNIS